MMRRYELRYVEMNDSYEIEHEISHRLPSEMTLEDMLSSYRCFLKACGFEFKGDIGLYDEDEERAHRQIEEKICNDCATKFMDQIKKLGGEV